MKEDLDFTEPRMSRRMIRDDLQWFLPTAIILCVILIYEAHSSYHK